MKIVPFFKNKNWKGFLEGENVKILDKAGAVKEANSGRNGKGWRSGGKTGGGE